VTKGRGRQNSVEFLGTAYDSESRKGTQYGSTFNLVSTIIGGGILSLPYAFSAAGYVLGPIFLLIAAFGSDFSIYILVSCARRTGAKSYEEVCQYAFGKNLRTLTVFVLFVLCLLASVAYVVLARDLLLPICSQYFGITITDTVKTLLAICWIAVISPACFLRSMNGLAFLSLFSVLTMVVLCVAIGIRSTNSLPERTPSQRDLIAVNDIGTAITAFPICCVSFLCHFNVLGMHEELVDPTRKRIKQVVHSTIGITSVFYLVVGMLGYLFAYDSIITSCDSVSCYGVDGDVLLNFKVRSYSG
jgi:amino acid permease